jgi:AraC-like DNA-binding protein
MLQGLFIAIFFQSLVLSLLCFTIQRQNRANWWLGIFFATIALQRLFQLILASSDFFYSNPVFIFLFESLAITGIYFLQRFVFSTLRKAIPWGLHIYLATLGLQVGIFMVGFVLDKWAGVKAYYHHPVADLVNGIIFAYTIYAIVSSLRNIQKGLDEPHLNDSRSRLILNAARWLLYYWGFRMVIALVFMLIRRSAMSDLTLANRMEHVYLLIVNLLLILLLGFIAYFSLRNPQFFEAIAEKENPTVEEQIMLAMIPATEKKMMRLELPQEEVAKLMEKINRCMAEERPWLDPKFTLPKLADITGIPAYKISRVIKQETGQHFSEFVNQHRVQYAQTLLTDPNRALHTMYAIALDSGYASEAPFYAAFKKITGLSPAAWREQQNRS